MNAFDAGIQDWALSVSPTFDAAVRLTFAAMIGGVIGLERELRGRAAGFRTNFLIALASALVMILGEQLVLSQWRHGIDVELRADLIRIIQAVMVGIGFLGSGIVKNTRGTQGLTTAATAWAVAVVGLCAGMGLYTVSLIATGLVYLALTIMTLLEDRFLERTPRRVVVRLPWSADAPRQLVERINSMGYETCGYVFKRNSSGGSVVVQVTLVVKPKDDLTALTRQIGEVQAHEVLALK